MKTIASFLALPMLALSQNTVPPKPAPRVVQAAPRVQQTAPRVQQPAPRPQFQYPPKQQVAPRYTPPPQQQQHYQAAPRTEQASPRYSNPEPRVQQAAPRSYAPATRYGAPRPMPAVRVMPRMTNGDVLTRAFVMQYRHNLFPATVRARNYQPGFVMRVDMTPPVVAYTLDQEMRLAVGDSGFGRVFIPGYFLWVDGDFVWIDPTWASPPDAGDVWVQPQWVQQDDGTYALQEGYWMDPSQDGDGQ